MQTVILNESRNNNAYFRSQSNIIKVKTKPRKLTLDDLITVRLFNGSSVNYYELFFEQQTNKLEQNIVYCLIHKINGCTFYAQ